MEPTPKEKIAKISERMPYIEMCLDHKKNTVTITVDTLYELMFTQNTV